MTSVFADITESSDVKSPGVRIQRAMCLFGMINLLFLTDVVADRYGRGYRSIDS
jgi:hypothetical protein